MPVVSLAKHVYRALPDACTGRLMRPSSKVLLTPFGIKAAVETSITFANVAINFDSRFAAMMVIVVVAGIIRGFTGFGSALLTVPALTVLFGPARAVVIEVLIEIPVSIGLLSMALKEAESKTILPMLVMFALFVPLGTLLLTIVNPDYVRVFISLIVLFSVGLMARKS